jgi:hypothetical protein
MADANEDDRLQKMLRQCWHTHQAQLIQLSELQLTRELLYAILAGAEPPEKWRTGRVPTEDSIKADLFGRLLAIWWAVNAKP